MLRRRREKKTDYRQRLALLKSGKMRLVVRRGLRNVHVQLIESGKGGDKTVLEETSRNLRNYGWKGHCGNVSAAYLTGLLIGLKARKNGISSAILNSGLQASVKGSAIYACTAGAKDAGLDIPLGDVLQKERIEGIHIAEYAKKLKANREKYQRQFSEYLKNNMDPETLPAHFEEVKNKILKEFGAGGIGTANGASGSDKEAAEDSEEWEEVK